VATADLHRLTRLQRENAAWALLRADNAAVTLSLLGAHFDHGTRRLPAPELFARIDVDLQAMRDEGFDLPPAPARHTAPTGCAPGSCCAAPTPSRGGDTRAQ